MTASPRRRRGTPRTGRTRPRAESPTAVPIGTLARRIAHDLHRRLEALTESALRVRAQRLRAAIGPGGRLSRTHATDAEAIHDLRVAARRLTAWFWLWRPALDRAPRRKGLRLLRRMRRRFGPLREAEVHARDLAERLRSGPGPAPAAFARLAAAWRERYRQDRVAALERIDHERMRSLRIHVEDALAALPERLREPDVRARVRRRLAACRREAQSALALASTADLAAIEPFHAARIAVKKWRYGEERWHAAMGTESRVLERLRVVQETLGRAHDCATLRRAITEGSPASPVEVERAPAEVGPLVQELLDDERAALVQFRDLVPALFGRAGGQRTTGK